MSVSNLVIKITDALKPVLVKIIPQEYLSRAKKAYMNRNTTKLKDAKIAPYKPGRYAEGINLIGSIQAASGLGQSSRLVAVELEASGMPYSIKEHHISEQLSMTEHEFDAKFSDELPYDINLLHINAHEFTVSYMQLGKQVWDYRYNIAFWLWELEEFPAEWIDCISIVDEIWTPAEFVSNSIRKVTDKPVHTIPYHVTAPTDDKYDRAYFGLPEDKFLFLMMYDNGSMMERKNPLGTLEAFKRAFGKENDEVGLVIKISGNAKEDMEKIREFFDGYTNIYFMTEMLTKIEVNSLLRDVDVFVSLHRAEGFGLGMAEAMLNGTPCIATNWSANTEFMDEKSACMVDYQLIELTEDIGPFKAGNRWADADVAQAAEYMKRLYADKAFYDIIKNNALSHINEVLSEERITVMMRERVEAIRKEAKEALKKNEEK